MSELFAVSRNGAVWKCHDRLESAIQQAKSVAEGTAKYQDYEGFDENGKSAVVSRPVTVRVERLNRANTLIKYEAEWIAGERVG